MPRTSHRSVVQIAVTLQKLPPTLPPGEVRVHFVNTLEQQKRLLPSNRLLGVAGGSCPCTTALKEWSRLGVAGGSCPCTTGLMVGALIISGFIYRKRQCTRNRHRCTLSVWRWGCPKMNQKIYSMPKYGHSPAHKNQFFDASNFWFASRSLPNWFSN